MANKIPRVPVREQDPAIRATNFDEVCYGYNLEEAQLEASRCLDCKNPRCVQACPVGLQIPRFIDAVNQGNLPLAAEVISRDSSLPSICGRVCPQESQCEGACILGIKGESVAIGKIERFVGDWMLEHPEENTTPVAPHNGHRVAVVGSGPAGLACASDLAKWGYEVTVFEALHQLGGVLVYGIPEFRLPKERIVSREIAEVERLVNVAIAAKVPVVCEEMTVPEAKAKGAIGLFESKYGELVRTYKMGEFSFEICGGPHAENTGDLVSFKIQKEESSSAGVRRIKAVIK